MDSISCQNFRCSKDFSKVFIPLGMVGFDNEPKRVEIDGRLIGSSRIVNHVMMGSGFVDVII